MLRGIVTPREALRKAQAGPRTPARTRSPREEDMDPNRLKGKNILITGAARGMGAANAELRRAGRERLPRRPRRGRAQEVADQINAAGNGKAIAVKMDVTKREDNAAAVAATVEAFGSINVGCFNAGLNKPRFFMDIDEDNWDMIMTSTPRRCGWACRKPPAR
jgi:NAD(P)-dependent dehydrogenase (short-subunit alcohol dehydrogenase family)